jgi:hypothetical protein
MNTKLTKTKAAGAAIPGLDLTSVREEKPEFVVRGMLDFLGAK